MSHDVLLSCCYYPTTILFLDDDPSFLKNLCLNIDNRVSYQLCTTPEAALRAIDSAPKLSAFIASCFVQQDTDESDDDYLALSLDLKAIYKKYHDLQRRNSISVLITDQEMPGQSGLEICEALRLVNIKKIMLTGLNDLPSAIQAFNAGLIDRFLLKSSNTLLSDLNHAIAQLQKKYFQELSLPVMQNLIASRSSAFYDKKYIQFFHQLCKTKQISEYYLIDASGSYLMVDNQGVEHWCIVKNEVELANYATMAAENDAPSEVRSALSKREKLPFFFNAIDFRQPYSHWNQYLYPCEKLVGDKQNYYYAICNKINPVVPHQGVADLLTA